MRLADRGALRLDAPVQRYLKDFHGEGKEAVTVRHLLAHTSGLRAFLPLHTMTDNAQAARARVMEEPLRRTPGALAEYSDLNAILMGWVIEAVTGLPLDTAIAREVTQPLGMTETRYRLPRSLHERAAPINRWRGHPIRGVVHDQNAERLNGVSGHAGIYSTGRDLARYAMMYLGQGRVGPTAYVSDTTVQAFIARGRGNRALGWEMNDTTTTDNTGTLLTPRAFGHGGYTGTSMWIDPGTNVFVIILTNRVFAPKTSRSIRQLKEVRADVADAAVRLKERTCRLVNPALAGC
jgi:CubicO group peptidase (beta-lactamase class C family)